MNKTASSSRTNPLREGAISFGYLPFAARKDPKGVEQVTFKNSYPGSKETLFHKKSPLALITKGQQEVKEFSSYSLKG